MMKFENPETAVRYLLSFTGTGPRHAIRAAATTILDALAKTSPDNDTLADLAAQLKDAQAANAAGDRLLDNREDQISNLEVEVEKLKKELTTAKRARTLAEKALAEAQQTDDSTNG